MKSPTLLTFRSALVLTVSFSLAALQFAPAASPESVEMQWPQFRGPAGNPSADSASLPVEWNQDKNVQWKTKIPGTGWSSPIIWNDKIIVTTAVTENQPRPAPGGGRGGGGPGGAFGGPPGGRFDPPGGGQGGGFGGPDGKQRGSRGNQPPADNNQSQEGGPDRRPGGPGGGPDGKQGGGFRPGGGRRGEGPGRDGQGSGRDGGRDGQGFGRGGGRGDQTPPDVTYRWQIHVFDANSGKEFWKKTVLERKPTIPTHRTNTYASETPVTDGERIYAYFGMLSLVCLNFQGDILWQKELPAYPMMNGWGAGSSPTMDADRLFIQCDNEQSSFLTAIDKKTGSEVWRVVRDEKSTWSTPFLWKNRIRTELVVCGGQKVKSHDPATGAILWQMDGKGARFSSTPAADDDMIYLGGGGGMGPNGPLVAIRAGSSGEISDRPDPAAKSGVVWSRPNAGPPMASPLLYNGYLYVLEQRGGMVSCYDAKTGEPAYFRQRLPDARGFTSSPWAADGKVYCLDEEGQTFVLAAGPTYKLLGKNSLGEMCWATPALSKGTIVLRTLDHLYSLKQ